MRQTEMSNDLNMLHLRKNVQQWSETTCYTIIGYTNTNRKIE